MFETLCGLNKVVVPLLCFQAHQTWLFSSVSPEKPSPFWNVFPNSGCYFSAIVWSMWIKVILDKLPPKFPKLLGGMGEGEKDDTVSHLTHTEFSDSYNLQTIFWWGEGSC